MKEQVKNSENSEELKKVYDLNRERISELHKENEEIRKRLQDICSHKNVMKLDEEFLDPFNEESGTTTYKCLDCLALIEST
ncbi:MULTISPECIES: hypothetical protein [Bacillus amyloliquefaciens group]|uniref:hypothetical protein n=1 Tax=Bacillus amyloliquefaciens group TaxID=1938374 RepID=UPI00073D0650|nr:MULTISPECIES: hypothetical protein [Bacillus amyloliquefaciens group]KTF59876.1 hypothetical protein AR691_14195 [Bacillus amyloliquefaciens]